MELKDYWNDFYKNKLNLLPSQFAVFVANEYPEKKNLIDFGCGSARDTFFFKKFYENVIGIDASSQIINLNQNSKKTFKNLTFLLDDLSNEQSLANVLKNTLKDLNHTIFYARFFLHAIDENVENKFLNIYNFLKTNDSLLAVEFRTIKDMYLEKEFGNHYRRFIDPNQLIIKLKKIGISVLYFKEGQGFAKYKSDDAYVARLILS